VSVRVRFIRERMVDKYEIPQQQEPEKSQFVVFWAPPPFVPRVVGARAPRRHQGAAGHAVRWTPGTRN